MITKKESIGWDGNYLIIYLKRRPLGETKLAIIPVIEAN
jgi:hypothetical protein